MLLLITSFALLLDRILGELPNQCHPLVWFGISAKRLESRFNHSNRNPWQLFLLGLLSLLLLVILPVGTLIILMIILPLWANMMIQIAVVYFCLGWQSLRLHTLAIITPLQQDELNGARSALAMIVSRDTSQLSRRAIARATTESLLENGNDAIFATLFWFALLGAPGALAHRLINTLDGMWGYRNARYEYFGKTAARLDDLLNYLPARLTALSYALVSASPKQALTCWWRQAAKHDSPNAGVVMATGAGALSVRLGGGASYHGVYEKRPTFGIGHAPTIRHIYAALRLITKSIIIWLIVLAALWQ